MAKSIKTKAAKKIVHKNNFIKHKYDANTQSGDIQLESITITKNGTYYAEPGKAFNSITVNVTEFLSPSVSVSITPDTVLYDKEIDTLRELIITANVTKGTNEIALVRIAINGNIVKEFTNPDVSILQFTQTFNPATKENQTVTVTVFDSENKTATASKKIDFVLKSYYGTVPASIVAPDAALITSLNSKLVGSKSFVYSGITMDYGKVLYAYPVGYGAISTIKDTVNNLSYDLASFPRSTVSINGNSYYCYLLSDAAAADNVQLTFA